MRKIIDGLAVLAFVLSASIAGGAYFGYKYITSPQFEITVKNKLMNELKNSMPKAIEKQLPKTTGIGLPF
jgi:type II secretory pathway component PulJ